jgi:hypothetical protein
LAAGTAFDASGSDDATVAAALKELLSKTEVAKADCTTMKCLREVADGKSIFYVN